MPEAPSESPMVGLPEINTSHSLSPTTGRVSFLHLACYSPAPRAFGWAGVGNQSEGSCFQKGQAWSGRGDSSVRRPEGGWELGQGRGCANSRSWTSGADLSLERAGLWGRGGLRRPARRCGSYCGRPLPAGGSSRSHGVGMRCKKEGLRASCVQGWLPYLPRKLPWAQGQWDTSSFPNQGETQVSPPAASSSALGTLGSICLALSRHGHLSWAAPPGPWGPSS